MSGIVETARCFRRLLDNPDFKDVLEHIRRERERAQSVALKASEPTLIYRAQGRFEALDALERLGDLPSKPASRGNTTSF